MWRSPINPHPPTLFNSHLCSHLQALSKISIFRGLEEAFLVSVSVRMRIVMFTPKEVIFM